MELDDYQLKAIRTDQRPGDDEGAVMFPIIGLASEVGTLVKHFKKRIRDGDAHELFVDEVAEELGDVLWYVANLASKLDLSLESIAARNLSKVGARWPVDEDPLPLPLADEAFPADEQLPRRAEVRFEEERDGQRAVVRLFRGEEMLGNHLTDNAYVDDGYRFHDAFHLTYAALLGWSPVSRFFFGCKRNSDPSVREVEDGGRAGVIEESIAAFVFDYARKARFLDGVQHVDYTLLTTIRSLVSQLEVRERTAREWESAILRSYEMWRALRQNGGGVLAFDLHARTIEYRSA
jgi:NTP pyrophosphatase (non-canonical NTP hydrolase)